MYSEKTQSTESIFYYLIQMSRILIKLSAITSLTNIKVNSSLQEKIFIRSLKKSKVIVSHLNSMTMTHILQPLLTLKSLKMLLKNISIKKFQALV